METFELKGKKLNMSQIFSEEGQVIPVTLIKAISPVDSVEIKGKPASVSGISKGKGFTGVIKRWNFKRQPMTRGASNKIRTGGAIGSQTPGKVFKGKKMAGRSGGTKVTIHGLEIVDYKADENLVFVSGSVPGARNSDVTLKVHLD